jgi:MFS family permease
VNTRERRALGGLFFLFAFGTMSWAPRFPEIKHNLGVSNGQFGTLVSLAAIGSLTSLATIGQLVHRYGPRRIMTISTTFLFLAIGLVVHARQSWQFFLCNLVIGASLSAFHIALNGQALHEQKPDGENLMPRFHGLWALGALTSAAVSGLLAGRVSLDLHIGVLAITDYIVTLLLLRLLGSTWLQGSDESIKSVTLKELFSKAGVDWAMGVCLTCAVILEAATADWAAIFSKEDLHMSPGVSTVPYISFMSAMIIGRLTVHKVLNYIGLGDLIKRCVIIGGGVFFISDILGLLLTDSHQLLGFSIVVIGSFFGGLGASFLAPTIMNAGNLRSKSPGSVVIGQLSAINVVFILFGKSVIAWTAQATSVGIALLLPTVMLMMVAFFAKSLEMAGLRTD